RYNSVDNECIPDTSIKEYHPFQLWSSLVSSFVSRELSDNVLVAGIDGDKSLQQLEFCVVTADQECSTEIQSSCIAENIQYRFRVNGPLEGYLHIEGPFLRIVEGFDEASSLTLQKTTGKGLRVVHPTSNSFKALTVFHAGGPLLLDRLRTNDARQEFEILQPNNIGKKAVSLNSDKCVSDVEIKEYQPFQLLSFSLDSFVSKRPDSDLLVGGIFGSKNFLELEFCIVSTDEECTTEIETGCIREDQEYYFRVHGPVKGYLRVEGDSIRIVKDFDEASGLSLYRAAGWGLRIAHKDDNGRRLVFTITEPGKNIELQESKETSHQSFRLEAPETVNKNVESFSDNQCVPETSIREYHPFLLKSSNLDTYVSKMRVDNIIVGGIIGNKNFQELELCIASSEYGCNAEIKSNCIYQHVDYRFRVNSPVHGYLRIVENQVEIVADFKDASSLNLYKEAGWGLRIAHLKKDGSRIVFSATEEGESIKLEEMESNAKRQWFQLIESN
ncbi:hypothetical protein BG003_010713, partial [Podila horticola]